MFIVNPSRFTVAGGGGGSDAATVSYIGNYTSDSGFSSTRTVTSGNIGSAEHVLAVVYYNDKLPTSCTIGGNSATGLSFNGSGRSYWYIAAAPVDTTPDIVVTFSGSMNAMGVAVYGITNLESTTPTDTDYGTSLTNNLSVTTESNGIVIVSATGNNDSTITFSSLTKHFMTEWYGAGEVFHAGGSQQVSGTTFNQTVQFSGSTVRGCSLVSFR